ncbi:hypothetical protein BAUCODRAFT_100172 [Baudoinia panamericana UAMH 10762]|uniref:SET domain-containing protein n=1 Tax=Baudoinia panamericana (strain UAMH 10762) TaxID=717646 RepID=M2N978_BAUPA|nr:uncharacterized protein BAUCODRAFT_100172 [Baudoinia panamericana UAMH 10762]EMD00724.1 hypothetical protein BAUCODRAFT_100172 [Baudoinia panamericana UAMH 10762]
MPTLSSSWSTSSSNARAAYTVHASAVSKVLCHRLINGNEQYLVRWKTEPEFPVPPRAICSWHSVPELQRSLHHVQTYIESLSRTATTSTVNGAVNPINRKRKAPGADPLYSRDSSLGANGSAYWSREASVISVGSSSETSNETPTPATEVYNGVLQRKSGKITVKKSRDPAVVTLNVTKLPTPQMLEVAATAPTSVAERTIREAFDHSLSKLKHVRWENGVDGSAPSLNFTFVDGFILRDGVYRPDASANVGCTKPCKPNMGQNVGCEYPRMCTCLEYAAVDEPKLERSDPERYALYIHQKETEGYFVDTEGLPKRFPYQKPNADPRVPSVLLNFYLESRYPIYECNEYCACGPVCKSRVVQKGRRVPLVIFKTRNRGWGVYCDEELAKGEFIDTYIGEVITNEEADRREAKAGKAKASYLYNLDKFDGDDGITADTCFVVDGQYMGGPTRFMNHSCEPNCRQYTVSQNKHDLRIYDLAFFAIQDIPAGTELTFDYMDKDELEEEEVVQARHAAALGPDNMDKKPCNCGSRKCRGFLWV